MAVSPSGAVWAWGRNSEGQLGNSSTIISNLPVQTSAVAGWSDIIGLASGTNHNLGLKSDGSIWSWGFSSYGQLGLGNNTTTQTAPVLLANLKLANDDTDSDGLPDSWERFYFAGSLSQSAGDIAVTGGVTNLVAYTQRLNPVSGDTDKDGMLDGWEITNSLQPLSDDSLEDKDGDRIPNIFEFMRGKTNANDSSSKPATTFIVDPSTGGNSTTDNIYTTIQAAVTQANRSVYNSVTSQYEYPDRYAVIEVKAGTYPEQVYISSVPVLLLGELGAASGPVTITGQSDYDSFTLEISTASAVDGFIITHSPGRKGVGVQLFDFSGGVSNRRRFVNCMIHGNDYTNGGGVRNIGCLLDLVHCFITGNKAANLGRGIYSSSGKLNLINSIVWGNGGTASQEIQKGSGDPISVTSSIVANGEHGGILINPSMNPHGWLKSTSPAIKRSGTTLAAASRVDIHGEARGGTPDIGADEFVSSDGDNLPDFWEKRYFGNLTKSDNDDNDVPSGDGLSNYYEYHFGFDPLLPLTPGNLVSDLYEAVILRKNDAIYPDEWKTDADDDGLTAGQELYHGSSPLVSDSNGDGIADGMALSFGLSPASNDTDGDGVSNVAELTNGTSLLLADTDGDGVLDNLDAYPLDPGRTSFTPGAAGDTVAPIITLIEPVGAMPVP